MRLKSLKLAGFKSFVDPIEIDFPGIMCGIVGPMDAVNQILSMP